MQSYMDMLSPPSEAHCLSWTRKGSEVDKMERSVLLHKVFPKCLHTYPFITAIHNPDHNINLFSGQ